MLGLVVIAAIVAGLIGLRLWAGHTGTARAVPPLGSTEWMSMQSGLPQPLADDPALLRYARRTRVWRAIGVCGAIVGSIGWAALRLGDNRTSVNFTVALFIGWFGAGVLPELFVRNRRATEQRAAALAARAPGRFVTPTARRWLTASYVGIVAAIVVRQVVTHRVAPSRADAAAILASCILLTVVGTIAVWRIARRHQPAAAPNDVAVDDAIRFLATTRAVSGWTALNFIAVVYLSPAGGFPHADLVHGAFRTLGAIGAMAAWAWVPTRLAPRRASSAVQTVPA